MHGSISVRAALTLFISFVVVNDSFRSAAAAVGTLADGNGQVVGWGANGSGQGTIPPGSYKAIESGDFHSVAIRSDGSLAAWGNNSFGQTNLPLSFASHTAIAAGGNHSLAIRADGTLTAWGYNDAGQLNIPGGSFTAIAAGYYHSMGIRTDGTLAGWGYDVGVIPNGTFTAISGGSFHSLGIRSDGTLAGWGANTDGQGIIPSGTFTAIAAGGNHNLAIRADGTLVGWGRSGSGQINVPGGSFTGIAAGLEHSLGIRSDGTLAGWGSNGDGQTNVPNGTFVAVAADGNHSLALRARTDYDGDLLIFGSGPAANLNRSINVVGSATVQTTANFYNNPTVAIDGKLTLAPGAAFAGASAGTIIADGLDVRTDFILPASFSLDSGGPLTGTGSLTLGNNSNMNLALAATSAYTGSLSLQTDAVLALTGNGVLRTSGLTVGDGAELRLAVGQRLQVANTSQVPIVGKIEVLGNSNVPGGTAELELNGFINAFPSALITGRDAVMRFGKSFGASGLYIFGGSLALTSGANELFGDIENDNGGRIVVTGGASATFYDDVVQNATLRVSKVGSTTSTAVFLGAFSGSGGSTGGGDIFFEGDLRPGNSPAIVTFGNNVSFGDAAALQIELSGAMPGTQYDQIQIAGEATLGGTLDIDLIDGFTPSANSHFTLLTFASGNGQFDEVLLPALPAGFDWSINYGPTSVTLSVSSTTLPGDIDLDHDVDRRDAALFSQFFGRQSGSTWSTGDFNGDHATTLADLVLLQTHLGRGGPSLAPAAVPEPTAFSLALWCLAFGLHFRTATRRH